MRLSPQTPRVFRFGVFEVDPREGELRKSGLRIRLQDQPFQVLVMLLEHPGEIVTPGRTAAKALAGRHICRFRS
jgi:DNA-binding winged helix-turn-helix (wHTH) protein